MTNHPNRSRHARYRYYAVKEGQHYRILDTLSGGAVLPRHYGSQHGALTAIEGLLIAHEEARLAARWLDGWAM